MGSWEGFVYWRVEYESIHFIDQKLIPEINQFWIKYENDLDQPTEE